jgi:hypothetical protein
MGVRGHFFLFLFIDMQGHYSFQRLVCVGIVYFRVLLVCVGVFFFLFFFSVGCISGAFLICVLFVLDCGRILSLSECRVERTLGERIPL